MPDKPIIIPVASGKGGVGKTMFTANLAIALAQQGHNTVAVDLDLGGSNLHSYLGIDNSHAGIGDFLKSGKFTMNQLLVNTGIDNLRFLPGDGRTPFMANIPFEQRSRLVRELMTLQAEYILLDLGAGSSFNTLNFFGIAHKGIIITTFEGPAMMNSLTFLKNFIFRLLISLMRPNPEISAKLKDAFRRPIHESPQTISTLLTMAAEIDPEMTQKAGERLEYYRPRIIFNMGEDPEELRIAEKIGQRLLHGLSLEHDFFGYIQYDDEVRQAAKKRDPLLIGHPGCPTSKAIQQIARRVIMIWDRPIPDSAKRLLIDTRKRMASPSKMTPTP